MSETRLLGPAEIRDLAELLDVTPTKKLGQNFVIDANTVRRIVRVAGVQAGDTVVEVGPGLGSLTLGKLIPVFGVSKALAGAGIALSSLSLYFLATRKLRS